MRWKLSEPPPKNGEIRTRTVFAWKKTKVENYIVWLEFYFITEKYLISSGGMVEHETGSWSERDRRLAYYYI